MFYSENTKNVSLGKYKEFFPWKIQRMLPLENTKNFSLENTKNNIFSHSDWLRRAYFSTPTGHFENNMFECAIFGQSESDLLVVFEICLYESAY